jgi:hypothetical protein
VSQAGQFAASCRLSLIPSHPTFLPSVNPPASLSIESLLLCSQVSLPAAQSAAHPMIRFLQTP